MKWPLLRLEQLASPEPTAIKIGPFGSQLKKDELANSGIHVIGIENVLLKKFDGLGDRFISDDKFSELFSVEVRPGDVLVTMMGTIGKVAIVPPGTSTSIMDSHLLRFRPNQKLCTSEYVAWLIKGSPQTQAALHGRAHGAIMKGLNSGIIRSLPAPLPTPSEQRRIVSILNQADAIRTQRSVADGKAERILSALFCKMFGDPATNPKQWPSKPLEEVAQIGTELVDPMNVELHELMHVGGENIEKCTGRISGLKTVGESDLKSVKFLFTEKHILYCKIRPYLNKVAYPRMRGLCSADIYPILPVETMIRPSFLVSLLRSPAFLAFAEVHSERLRMPKLNRDQLGAFKVPIPDPVLQDDFESFATKIEELYRAQKSQREQFDQLFAAMLHRAFSGSLTAKWREAHMKELLVEMEQQAKVLSGSC